MIKKFAIVVGDPISINSEIIVKTWKKLNYKQKNFFLIGSYELFKSQINKLKINAKFKKMLRHEDKVDRNYINILDIPIKFKTPFKIKNKQINIFVKKSLDQAHYLSKNKFIKGFINCPVNKKKLEFINNGVTEYLSKKNNLNDSEVMLLYGKKFSVSPITTHIPLKDVAKKLTKKKIIEKVMNIQRFFVKFFNRKPSINILGLNPHNAEFDKTSEEKKIIIPAIDYLKKKGLKLKGPLPADSIFANKNRADIIVGMYHDQVLPIFKMVHKFDAINLTLGLNYIRISPDHGTAQELIFKNKADIKSLKKCINFINSTNV